MKKNTKKNKGKNDDWHIERLDPRHSRWYSRKLIAEHVARYSFAKHYVDGKIVADLGCGTGYGSNLIAFSGAKKVYGIDIDKKAIEYAQKNHSHENISYIQASAEKTKLPDKSIDVAISFETIEHLEHPEKLLLEIKRILKPGGICILSTPNAQYSYGDNPYHLKEFTPSELKKELQIFSSIHLYGQRSVNSRLVTMYKYLHRHIPISFIRLLLRFRPWENVKINKETRLYTFPYLYIVAICRK
jgi:2-polyprenyl-3-methyl-5-hydroxy-6-metoxy-1,4-benzoquinol methylase